MSKAEYQQQYRLRFEPWFLRSYADKLKKVCVELLQNRQDTEEFQDLLARCT